jgi:hypothetical protein
MFPRGFELVYDNYNALVFGISPTERTSDAFISVAGYPRWVTLFFLHGADLRDTHGLLEGQGKQVRSVRLREPKDINTPEVEALIAQAVLPYESAFLAAPSLSTIVKSVSAKQRPRCRENDAQFFHRADASNLRLSCGCCSYQGFMWASTQTDLLRQCKTINGLRV